MTFWLLAAALAAALYFAIHRLASRFVYEPRRYPDWWPDTQTELGAQDVWLQSSDGVKLHAWWIERPHSQVVTLYLHGNGDNVSYRPGHLREMIAAGSSVLIVDYRGFGRSEGRPSERGLYRDADAAYDYLIRQGIPAERIVLHGESLGSAVAVDLASRRPCAGVILECPIPSVTVMAGRVVPWLGPLFVYGYDASRKIGRVHAPLLIIHGDDDRRVPIAMGRALFDAANPPKSFWAVPGARHLNIVQVAGSLYVPRLRVFYQSLGLTPA